MSLLAPGTVWAMEIHRFEGPPSRQPWPSAQTMAMLGAIAKVRKAWEAAGREPVLEHYANGRIKLDPEFKEDLGPELAAAHEAARAAARAARQEPQLTVAEVVKIEELPEAGRLVCRATVRWSNDAVGEALAWYVGTAQIIADELLGRTRLELDFFLLRRLHEQRMGGTSESS